MSGVIHCDKLWIMFEKHLKEQQPKLIQLFFRKRKEPSHQDTDVESLLLRQITRDLKNAVQSRH